MVYVIGRALSTETGIAPFKVGVLGDSITVISYSSAADASNYNLQGWASWLRILSKQAIDLSPSNIFGSSGIDSAGVISGGHHTNAAAAGLNACIIAIGVNDAASGSLVPADTISNMNIIISTILASGAIVVLQPILPNTTLSAAQRKKAYTINAYYRKKARTDKRIIMSDPTPRFIDATDANGNPLTNYTYDGLHPATIGAYVIGKTHWESLQDLVPPYDRRFMNGADVYDATANVNGNLLTNGLLNGTSGTKGVTGSITGNVATGWDVSLFGGSGSPACACSKVSRTDGESGIWQQLALSGSNGAAGYYRFFQLVNSNYSAGNLMELICEFEVDSGFSNLTGIRLEIFDYDAGTGGYFGTRDGVNTAGQPMYTADTIRGVLRTPVHTAITSSDYLAISVNAEFDSGTLNSTIRIGRVALRKIT